MGQHGLDNMNENGEILADFFVSNEMVIVTKLHGDRSTQELRTKLIILQLTDDG